MLTMSIWVSLSHYISFNFLDRYQSFSGCILINDTIHDTILTIGEAIEFCLSLNSRLLEIYTEEQKQELKSLTSKRLNEGFILYFQPVLQLRMGGIATG